MVSSVSFSNNIATFASASVKPATAHQANSADAAGAPANSSAASAATTGQTVSGVSTYDFTNLTPNQLQSVTSGLVKSGKLSEQQALQLSFVSATLGNLGPNGQFLQLSGAKSAAYSNQPVNYIQTINNQLAYLQQSGEASNPEYGYAALQTLGATLQALQGTTSGVNLTA
jgi:hypothetical protein